MTTMTDSRALAAIGEALHASAPKPGNWRDELQDAYAHIAARLREPAGVGVVAAQLRRELAEDKGWDYTEYEKGRIAEKERCIAILEAAHQPPAEAQAQCPSCRGAGSTPEAMDNGFSQVVCPDCAGSGRGERSITVNEAQAQVPSYDALLIIAQSVCGALERAGITDCDDPGEAIDVLRERYEAQRGGVGPRLTLPGHIGLYQGPDDCPHLQLNGVSVATFPAGSWSEVCDALDSITGSAAPGTQAQGGGKNACPRCGAPCEVSPDGYECVYAPPSAPTLKVRDAEAQAQGGGEVVAYSEKFRASGDWSRYPIGTRAYAIQGGYWEHVESGWRWCTGSTFPTPGGDAIDVAVPVRVSAPPSAPVGAADDFVSHRDAWREALNLAVRNAKGADDARYWMHEVRAFDKAYAALAQQPAPRVPEGMETELKAFDDWFRSEQGKPYDGGWEFGRAAWLHRASLAQQPAAVDGARRLIGLMREVVPALRATGVNVTLADDVERAAAIAAQQGGGRHG